MQEKVLRLRYQCRRGMLELDAILQPFFEKHFLELTPLEQEDFEMLLASSDQSLYNWFIGSSAPSQARLQALISKIKSQF